GTVLERRPLPLDREGRRQPQPFVRALQALPLPLEGAARPSAEPLDGTRESLPVLIERAPDAARERSPGAVEPAEQLSQLRHYEPSRSRRGRGPDVRCEVAERRVLLVPDSGDHGDGALGDRPDDAFVAEGEEVLEAAAAAGEDDDVH